MNTKLFIRQAVENKHRQGILGEHYDCFVKWMEHHGYAHETMRYNIQRVTHFSQYLKRRGIKDIDNLADESGEKLLFQYRKYWKERGHWGRNLGPQLLIRSLEESGVITKPGPNKISSSPIIEEYLQYLRNQRGLAKNTRRYHKAWMEKFLQFIENKGKTWHKLGISDIDEFVRIIGTTQKRSTHQLFIGCLKSFTRFLYHSKKTTIDLSTTITQPLCYKLESLPTVLEWADVKKLLSSVDCSTKAGVQQYGILILLSTYGLRAGEVAGLLLDDIDWKHERIIIRPGKTGRSRCLPLISEVAEAIINYLNQHLEMYF